MKKRIKIADGTDRRRIGDTMMITEIRLLPAVIDFAAILEAAVVEDDESSEAPWDDCDGYEHDLIDIPDDDRYNKSHVVYNAGYRNRKLVHIRKEQVREWGAYAYDGASKQVQAEARAANLVRTYEQIVDWYNNGYRWVGVVCNYAETIGEGDETGDLHDSLWGILDDGESGEYIDEVRYELAGNVADALTNLGYTITGRKEPEKRWYRRINHTQVTEKDLKVLREKHSAGMREAVSKWPALAEHYMGGKLTCQNEKTPRQSDQRN